MVKSRLNFPGCVFKSSDFAPFEYLGKNNVIKASFSWNLSHTVGSGVAYTHHLEPDFPTRGHLVLEWRKLLDDPVFFRKIYYFTFMFAKQENQKTLGKFSCFSHLYVMGSSL